MSGKPVLLFYADFDDQGPPSWITRTRRTVIRQGKRLANRPTVTGFEMWTRMLTASLRSAGRTVIVNDYEFARRHPHHPVGLTGYPQILSWWDLPNPAILGPGMLDHPAIRPTLMEDPRYRFYLVTSAWNGALFRPVFGSKVVEWAAGIDTADWPDTSGMAKRFDCLVYDKIRWHREDLVPRLLEPVKRQLERRGMTYTVLRYGSHSQSTYRRMLEQSRFMVFLCEHETQGLAYQEAMASNLPVFAWDPGFWVDPNRERYTPDPVPACSVPYFGAECGITFRSPEDLEPALARFVEGLGSYRPRAFVETNLSMLGSARVYCQYYDALLDNSDSLAF